MHIFSAIYDFLSNIWNNLIVLIFSSNNIVFDILDIVAVTFVIYKIIQFMRKTRAQQLLKGLIVFLAVYIVAKLLGLNAISWILSVVIANIIIVVAVLFQPEIRSILEKLGRQGISSAIKFSKNFEKEDASLQLIEIICKAVENMSKSRTGALIIIERKTMLNEIVNTGLPHADAIVPKLVFQVENKVCGGLEVVFPTEMVGGVFFLKPVGGLPLKFYIKSSLTEVLFGGT